MTTELDKLKAKVAEAVARRGAAAGSIGVDKLNLQKDEVLCDTSIWHVTGLVEDVSVGDTVTPELATLFAAHPTDIETMQSLLKYAEGLEADKAKLREPLVYYAMLGSGRCNISKKHVEMAQQALNETSDE